MTPHGRNLIFSMAILLWFTPIPCMGDQIPGKINFGTECVDFFSTMRCAQAFSYGGYYGGAAERVSGSMGLRFLFDLHETRDERISELYDCYYRASMEGKAYILWALYALAATEFAECKEDFLKRKDLQVNRAEGCRTFKETCEQFVTGLERRTKEERLLEIEPIPPRLEKKEKSKPGDGGNGGGSNDINKS